MVVLYFIVLDEAKSRHCDADKIILYYHDVVYS